MTNIKGMLLQSFSRFTVKCHAETSSFIALTNSNFDMLKNQDGSGWHFTFNSLDFLCSENLLGNMKKVRHQIQHFEINLLKISTNQKTSFGSKMTEILHLAIHSYL